MVCGASRRIYRKGPMDANPRRSQHSNSSTPRSSNGCWTCKLRRKKCDEQHPACDICTALRITCHGYDPVKPEWMDGGVLQEEMSKRITGVIKEHNKTYGRRMERILEPHSGQNGWRSITEGGTLPHPLQSAEFIDDDAPVSTKPSHSPIGLVSSTQSPSSTEDRPTSSCITRCTLAPAWSLPLSRSDNVLLSFYLEHLLPFMFPFFRPSLHEGGRAWLLELMIKSPVMRRATLCQSAYFFPLLVMGREPEVDSVLGQTNGAFEILRAALELIGGSSVVEHLHGTVRILASIMQVQRFFIALSSFEHCQAHLHAALALFVQILDSVDADDQPAERGTSFDIVMSRLGPPTELVQVSGFRVPSAEQTAFRFASSLLILDDIVASTVRQEEPKLYRYHKELLDPTTAAGSAIKVEDVVGCQNWVLLQVGETAALVAWKKRCKGDGDLDVMELVRRAADIKHALESGLASLELTPVDRGQGRNSSLADMFAADCSLDPSATAASDSVLVTRIWAHAALIYLSIMVSGWQPSNATIQCHIASIMQLTSDQKISTSLLRTMGWPLCVAGCLATCEQEAFWRYLLGNLQPAGAFAPLKKALQLMEEAWASRDLPGSPTDRDLATVFACREELVLLV